MLSLVHRPRESDRSAKPSAENAIQVSGRFGPEVNRAFSADASGMPWILGRCPSCSLG